MVGDDTRRATVETCETADDVACVVFLYLHEVAVINDKVDDILHVVRFVGVVRNDFVQALLDTHGVVGAFQYRCLFHIVLRDETYQTANLLQSLFLGGCHKVGYTRFGCVYACATQFGNAYVLTRNGFHYFRTRDEHIRVLLGHHDEVGQSRAVNSTTGARTEDDTYLGYDTRSEDVTLENLCITSQGASTFLDTRTTRVVQTDDRGTQFHGLVHHVANLQCHSLAQRSADDGSVLCEDEYQTTINSTRTYCHTIAKEDFFLHAEVVATVGKEHVYFLKRTLVEEHINTLAGGITALCVMFFDCCFAAACLCFYAVINQFLQIILIHNCTLLFGLLA